MRRSELREWLGQLEDSAGPEPSALFVARLETDLRAMDQSGEAHAARPRKWRRALIAAGPVAALTAAAAAAAVTLLPSDPHPRQVNTADPGVTIPAPPTSEAPPSSMPTPTPTTVVAPPWLPAVPAPHPTTTPTTAAARHEVTNTTAPTPSEHPTPTIAAPHEPVTTTVPPATTTTVPPPETLSLHCTSGMSGSNGVIFCGWSQSTSPAFKSYRLWREAQGSSLVVIFQSDNATTTGYYDTAVQPGTNYYYKVDVVDAGGNVIGRSNIVALSCC